MPIHNAVISKYGTEAEFISAFIKSMMNESAFSSNHTLVCKVNNSDDFATATAINSTDTDSEIDTKVNAIFESGRQHIWFIIDTHITVVMVRDTSSTASNYAFVTDFNGVLGETKVLGFYSGAYIYNYTQATRSYRYQIVSNANVLYIVFGGFNDTFPLVSNTYPSVFSYKTNSAFACGSTVSSTLRGADNQESETVDRLEYINNATNPTAIETIHNKVIVTSAGKNKVITMDNIWDSTYSPALMFEVNVTANNQNVSAVYLNNYTVMPI